MFATVSTKKNLTSQQKRSRAAVDYSSCVCKSGDEAARGSLPAQRPHSDQVISNPEARTAAGRRAPDPGLKKSIWFFQDHCWKQRHDPSYKRQATSTKHHAPIFRKQQASIKLQAASVKLSNQPVQSPSDKHPILNNKRQASSPE